MFRKTLILVGTAVILAACDSTTSPTTAPLSTVNPTANPASGNTVTLQNIAYNPASITAHVGDTVTWNNADAFAHTVTSDSGAPASFDSGNLDASGTFTFTFSTAGTYAYHCKIHASMHGTVTVS